MQTRKWQDQSGQDRYSTEVVLQGFPRRAYLLDRAGAGGQPAGVISAPTMRAVNSARPDRRAKSRLLRARGGARSDMDDGIPF